MMAVEKGTGDIVVPLNGQGSYPSTPKFEDFVEFPPLVVIDKAKLSA